MQKYPPLTNDLKIALEWRKYPCTPLPNPKVIKPGALLNGKADLPFGRAIFLLEYGLAKWQVYPAIKGGNIGYDTITRLENDTELTGLGLV